MPPSPFSAPRLARIGDHLQREADRGAIAGAVGLVAAGSVVHVTATGFADLATRTPMARDTIFRIASMSKTVLAVAAMILVERAQLRLDDPVDRWLPELADRQVLRRIDGPVTDTVAAARPICLRDLLTLRFGLGAFMMAEGTWPIQQAMADAGVAPGPDPIAFTPDDYMARMGSLPLAAQPGERWFYHSGYDVLAVLLARVAGRPLDTFLHAELFAPLGMVDTGFHVPPDRIDRLATCYRRADGDGLVVADPARGGAFAQPPAMPSELVSTVDDFLAFLDMLRAGGKAPAGRILSRAAVSLMMTDQISAEQKARSPFFPGFWESTGWGFGGGIVTRRTDLAGSVGSYGWDGGFGTSFLIDPSAGFVAIFMAQRQMESPEDIGINRDFMTLAAQAIDDEA